MFLIVTQSCFSQKTIGNDFVYQRSFFENKILVENYSYDSKTKMYEYQLIRPGSEKFTKKIEITLSEEAKSSIYSLYIKLQPKQLCNCMFEDGKKTYSSSIKFLYVSSPDSCNENFDDQRNYKIIEDKMYDFIESSPLYQKEFSNEFISK